MWNIIIYNWNLSRILRLGLGIFIMVEGIQTDMWMLIALGALFSLMPLLNIGCCATGNCNVARPKDMSSQGEVVYEEVKSKS